MRGTPEWGHPWGGTVPMSSPPSRVAEAHSCRRTSCLPPVGGVGKAAKPRPLFCVLDSEGWREKRLRGLGQSSILSWKLQIQSVHTHLHPSNQPAAAPGSLQSSGGALPLTL